MSNYIISQVSENDLRTLKQVDQLLENEGIKRDRNLDCICVMYDED